MLKFRYHLQHGETIGTYSMMPECRYYEPRIVGLDFDGMIADIKAVFCMGKKIIMKLLRSSMEVLNFWHESVVEYMNASPEEYKCICTVGHSRSKGIFEKKGVMWVLIN